MAQPWTSTWKTGDQPIDGYALTHALGKGAFGEVWKARDTAGRNVAVKIIDLQANPVAGKELRAFNLIKNLDHPNIVPVFTARLIPLKGKPVPFDKAEEAIRAGGLKYLVIVMGLGLKSLSARLKEINPQGSFPADVRGLPLDELVMYIEAAAEGIDYLNQQTHDGIDAKLDGAIVHCDIKPDNILIVAGGRAQIADCGVAVCINPDMRQTHAIGTPYYRPHELLNNQPFRGTDQYSLAVSYYELRTGRVPFPPGAGAGDVLIAHATGNLDFASHVLTDGERDALRRATRVNPADRFESCVLFYRTLKRAVRPLLNADGDSLRIPPPKATTGLVNPPRVLPPLPSNEIVDLELPPGIRPSQPTTRVPQPDGSLVDVFVPHDGGTLRPGVSPLPHGLTPTEPGINLKPVAVAPGGLIGDMTKTSDGFQLPPPPNSNGQTPINLGGLTPTNFEIDLAADALNRSFPAGPQFRSLPDLPDPPDVIRKPGTTAVPPAKIPTAAELHEGTKESAVAEAVVAPTDVFDILPVEPATEQEARARSTPALDLDKTPSIAGVELTTTPADSGVPIDPEDPAGPRAGPVVAGDAIQEILRKKRAERDRGKELDRTPAERVTPVPPAVEAKPKSPAPPPAPEPVADTTLPPWFKDAHGIPAKSKPSVPGLGVTAKPLGLVNPAVLFPPPGLQPDPQPVEWRPPPVPPAGGWKKLAAVGVIGAIGAGGAAAYLLWPPAPSDVLPQSTVPELVPPPPPPPPIANGTGETPRVNLPPEKTAAELAEEASALAWKNFQESAPYMDAKRDANYERLLDFLKAADPKFRNNLAGEIAVVLENLVAKRRLFAAGLTRDHTLGVVPPPLARFATWRVESVNASPLRATAEQQFAELCHKDRPDPTAVRAEIRTHVANWVAFVKDADEKAAAALGGEWSAAEKPYEPALGWFKAWLSMSAAEPPADAYKDYRKLVVEEPGSALPADVAKVAFVEFLRLAAAGKKPLADWVKVRNAAKTRLGEAGAELVKAEYERQMKVFVTAALVQEPPDKAAIDEAYAADPENGWAAAAKAELDDKPSPVGADDDAELRQFRDYLAGVKKAAADPARLMSAYANGNKVLAVKSRKDKAAGVLEAAGTACIRPKLANPPTAELTTAAAADWLAKAAELGGTDRQRALAVIAKPDGLCGLKPATNFSKIEGLTPTQRVLAAVACNRLNEKEFPISGETAGEFSTWIEAELDAVRERYVGTKRWKPWEELGVAANAVFEDWIARSAKVGGPPGAKSRIILARVKLVTELPYWLQKYLAASGVEAEEALAALGVGGATADDYAVVAKHCFCRLDFDLLPLIAKKEPAPVKALIDLFRHADSAVAIDRNNPPANAVLAASLVWIDRDPKLMALYNRARDNGLKPAFSTKEDCETRITEYFRRAVVPDRNTGARVAYDSAAFLFRITSRDMYTLSVDVLRPLLARVAEHADSAIARRYDSPGKPRVFKAKAVEDFCWMTRPNNKYDFDIAIAEFKSAITELKSDDSFDDPVVKARDVHEAQCGLGRCQYRAAAHGGKKADAAVATLFDLVEAWGKNDSKVNSEFIREAKYFLGMSYWLRGQLSEALVQFEELSKDHATSEFQQDWNRLAYLAASQVLARQAAEPGADRSKAAGEIQSLCDELQQWMKESGVKFGTDAAVMLALKAIAAGDTVDAARQFDLITTGLDKIAKDDAAFVRARNAIYVLSARYLVSLRDRDIVTPADPGKVDKLAEMLKSSREIHHWLYTTQDLDRLDAVKNSKP